MEHLRLPVVRLHIGEVRGFALITGHQHTQWLRDNRGQHLPGFVDALVRNQVGVWVWSREVWYGGPIDSLSDPGPYLEVKEGPGFWVINWGTTHGFEFNHVALFKAVAAYEQQYEEFDNTTVPCMVGLLQELIHQLSIYDPQGLGLLLVSLPANYRFILHGEPVLLRLYTEGNRVFPEDV